MFTVLLAKGQKGELAWTTSRYISCAPFPWWKHGNSTEDGRWWHCDDCDLELGWEATYQGNITTLLNMTCPDVGGGTEVVSINLLVPNLEENIIEKNLGGYCRQYC